MNHFFLLTCGSLLFASCGSSSEDDSTDKVLIRDHLLVQSLSYTVTEGNETNRIQEQYEYEDSSIIRRTDTNLDSGKTTVFTYTYTNDLISDVKIYDANDDLDAEINIYYNDNNQVYSYEYTADLNTNSPTYLLATFSYTEDQILHCDGKHWSSVEYKDVYDTVSVYTTDENGNIVQSTEIVDCDLSAPTTANSAETEIEYDSHSSPFINVNGNNRILNDIIGIFTDSRIRGFYNNATRLSESQSSEYNTQVWVTEYNDAGYPITIQWSLDTNREDVEITYY